MKLLTTLCLILLTSLCFAQTPVLVHELEEGQTDSYSRHGTERIYLGEHLLFRAGDGNGFEEELVILINGEVSMLKDINIGPDGSAPAHFTHFQDKVYFSAYDEQNGGAIWLTDGTTAGTQLIIDHNAPIDFARRQPKELVVTNGYLYYTYQDSLFRIDANHQQELMRTGVSFFNHFGRNSYNYTHYQDELAFLQQTKSGDSIHLYNIVDDQIKHLGGVRTGSSFTEYYGLSQVQNGLIFGLRDAFVETVTATYIYETATNRIKQLSILGEPLEARRLLHINDQVDVAWIGGSGYFLLNGVDNEEELLVATTNDVMTNGEKVEYAIYGDKFLFHATQGNFGDDLLVYRDAATNTTTTLLTFTTVPSNIITYNQYAFVVGKPTDFWTEASFYAIDMETGAVEVLYTFEQTVTASEIHLIGIQKDRLYFTSAHDNSVGNELYYIESNMTSTSISDNHDKFSCSVYPNPTNNFLYFQTNQLIPEAQLTIFNAEGQVIITQNRIPASIDVESWPTGLYWIVLEQNGKKWQRKIVKR